MGHADPQSAAASPHLRRRALTVLLVGEQQVLLAGVRQALAEDGITVVGVSRTTGFATCLAAELHPDVCLLLAPLAGGVVPAVEALRVAHDVRVVVVSADDDLRGELLLKALAAGADGWLSLDVPPDVLGRTLRAVHDGEAGISRLHVTRLLEALRRSDAKTARLVDGRTVRLTPREHETLSQLCVDTSTLAVARNLDVSQSTARWHIATLLNKLGASSRDDAVRLATTGALAPDGRAELS